MEKEDLVGGRTINQDKTQICREDMKDDNSLESTRLEINQARQENQRLKTQLNRIMEDYQTLYRKYTEIFPQDSIKSLNLPDKLKEEELEKSNLVSLSLGGTAKFSDPGDPRIKETLDFGIGNSNWNYPEPEPAGKESAGDYGRSRESNLGFSTDEKKEEDELKKMKDYDEDSLQLNNAKKTRVSVRARCDATTMNDGCQWRKYGQKISKGNPCPRAYYRCTVASSCPVRKQVQRCPEDTTILITIYEGTHNHPLPMSATAMASATSAAASMLISTAASSQTPTTTQNQFHITNPSSSSSHPTITLDLTSSSPSSSSPSLPPSSSLFNRFFSSTTNTNYSSKYLNFSENPTSSSFQSNNGLLLGSYGNINQRGNLNQLGQNSVYQPVILNRSGAHLPNVIPISQRSFPEEAIEAITSNPSFQSALAAVLTSIINNHGDDTKEQS